MRQAFPEHFVGEPERQQKLWADCIFVLDTNVLLDLYRFSDSAREALFKVMESLGERLWIPYQVAAEYFDNRLTVIEAQSKAYAESISGLKQAKEKFNSGSRHPFVSEVVFDQFIASYDLMIKELEDKQKIYLSYIGDDAIRTKIATLLDGRVGEQYTDEELQEVAIEGEKRYLENIPPGFQDGGKMPEATTTKYRLKKFGDLIIWKQVINKAAAINKPVIMVTGEKKDDWWLKSGKNLVSALPALSKEFVAAAKQDFYLYATDRFLLKANEYLEQSTSQVVVEEVRAINKEDAERKDDADAAFLESLPWNTVAKNPSAANKWLKAAWGVKGPTSRWFPIEADPARASELKYLIEQRELIKEKSQHFQAKLEKLHSRREKLLWHQRKLFADNVSLDDEEFLESNQQLMEVSAVIDAHEDELADLHKQMATLKSRFDSLVGFEGE